MIAVVDHLGESMTKGRRVRVTQTDGTTFDGRIERVIGANSATPACYLVLRDRPIVVNGVSRTAYWAAADKVVPLDDEPFDQARFEAQR